MKLQLLVSVFCILAIQNISGNCGCLKCSKHLRIVSPPTYPVKVIYRGSSCGSRKPLSYLVEEPVVHKKCPDSFKHYNYKVETVPEPEPEPIYIHNYNVEKPLTTDQCALPTLTGLVTRLDRVVVSAPDCPDEPDCSGPVQQPRHLTTLDLIYPTTGPVYKTHTTPTLEPLYSRYDKRSKRAIPILTKGIEFIVRLLPQFCRLPLAHALRTFKQRLALQRKLAWPYQKTVIAPKPNYIISVPKAYDQSTKQKLFKLEQHKSAETRSFLDKLQAFNQNKRLISVPQTYDNNQIYTRKQQLFQIESFLGKLQSLNRNKRAIFEDTELTLPFFRVKDIESLASDEADSEEDYIVGGPAKSKTDEMLKPLDFDQLIPHNPIFYVLNTPIRMLHHIDKFGQQLFPVLKSVPEMFANSQRYLQDVGDNFKNNFLHVASNLLGDFNEEPTFNRVVRPRRFRRNSNASQVMASGRFRRYILKLVDEEEVEEFLREKLGGLVQKEPPKATIKEENKSARKLVVEKLKSKLVFDRKGKPFMEIDGLKRPLFMPTNMEQSPDKEKYQSDASVEVIQDRIKSLIQTAKDRMEQKDSILTHSQEVPFQVIKEKINEILSEIQDLVSMDFDKYTFIYTNLCKLQDMSTGLVKFWKRSLIDEKSNDILAKIRILNELKDMQDVRDKCIEDIAVIVSTVNNFMKKKLIKTLIRLQKLQCLTTRIVDDFSEKIKVGAAFDVRKEIKYVDFLSSLEFAAGGSPAGLERDLARDRDQTLEDAMNTLDGLRRILEKGTATTTVAEEAKLLWEIKNIYKLQEDAIAEMNEKLMRGQRIKKELKILFDLLKQLELCEDKQRRVLGDGSPFVANSGEVESMEDSLEVDNVHTQSNKLKKQLLQLSLRKRKHLKPAKLPARLRAKHFRDI